MKERFVKFNFESPFVEGVDRVAELRKMLQRIRDGVDLAGRYPLPQWRVPGRRYLEAV